MSRYCLVTVFWFLVLVIPAGAAEIHVTPTLVFSLPIQPGWTLHVNDPPEALVKETASHIAHEPEAANATSAQINAVARKRLLDNEAIVYHAASGAHLDVDFSPLGAGESAPGARTLKTSAKYAAESLISESDVSEVAWDVSAAAIQGAADTYLLMASYQKHEESMVFRGYIGFVENAWFFLYFTAPAGAEEALGQMQQMLDQASIRPVHN